MAFPSIIRAQNIMPGPAMPMLGPSGITADLWETFEFATLSAVNLAANDNCATGSWVVSDVNSVLAMNAGGEYAVHSAVNGTIDIGTYGLSRSLSGGYVAGIYYDPAAVHNTMSCGFWYKSPTLTNYKAAAIIQIGSTYGMILRIGKDAAAPYFKVFGTAEVDGSGVSAATWYWITVSFVKNLASSVSIYDTTFALVYTLNCTARNYDGNRIYIGDSSGPSDVATIDYFDDLVLNWSTAPFPLGP